MSNKIKVNFNPTAPCYPIIYFNEIDINTAFKINSIHSKGAIYIKVRDESGYRHEYKMLEIYSGKIFMPTTSPITIVNVEIKIDDIKPSIYKSEAEEVPF